MLRIDDITLDVNEEWLVRNALNCYRDEAHRLAATERQTADRRNIESDPHRSLAEEWDRTVKRVDALLEKLG